MRTRGVKLLDPVFESAQVDWLFVSADECRGVQEESELVSRHFRKPHEPWGHTQAFVQPVCIRRSSRRVLFSQHSGHE